MCGTGTEDYFGGAWGFVEREGEPEQEYNSAFLGHPYRCLPSRNVGNGYIARHAALSQFLPLAPVGPDMLHADFRVTVQQIGLSKRGLCSILQSGYTAVKGSPERTVPISAAPARAVG